MIRLDQFEDMPALKSGFYIVGYDSATGACVRLSPDAFFSDLPDSIIDTAQLIDLCVTNDKLGVNVVTTSKLGNGAVSSLKLADEAVTTSKLGNNSVTTLKLDNGAVTASKLGNNSVTASKLDTSSVSSIKIVPGAVTESKLATESVSTVKIKNKNVTFPKIARDGIVQDSLVVFHLEEYLVPDTGTNSEVIIAMSTGTPALDLNYDASNPHYIQTVLHPPFYRAGYATPPTSNFKLIGFEWFKNKGRYTASAPSLASTIIPMKVATTTEAIFLQVIVVTDYTSQTPDINRTLKIRVLQALDLSQQSSLFGNSITWMEANINKPVVTPESGKYITAHQFNLPARTIPSNQGFDWINGSITLSFSNPQ